MGELDDLSGSTDNDNKRRENQGAHPSGNVQESEQNSNPAPRKVRRSRGRRRTKAQQRYRQTLLTEEVEQDQVLDSIHLADFGDELGPKPEGRFRLGGGNADVFNNVNFDNNRANLIRTWARDNELDGVFGQEGGLNWKLMPQSG